MYGMIFWMPQLLKAFSSQYSNTTVGMLVMVPHLVGVISMILVGRSSDRSGERRFHAAIPALIAATALLLLGSLSTSSLFLTVVLWCFVAMGVYSLFGPYWSLPNEFLTGFSAAAGIALINCIGNLGGFAGSYVIGAINRKTGSFHGGLVAAGISMFASALLILMLRPGEKRREPAPSASPTRSDANPRC